MYLYKQKAIKRYKDKGKQVTIFFRLDDPTDALLYGHVLVNCNGNKSRYIKRLIEKEVNHE